MLIDCCTSDAGYLENLIDASFKMLKQSSCTDLNPKR